MAALSTLFRIKERYQSRQMWLDDYLVILPMTVIIVYCIIPWILPSVSPGAVILKIILLFTDISSLIIKIPGQPSFRITVTLGPPFCSRLQSFGESMNCLLDFSGSCRHPSLQVLSNMFHVIICKNIPPGEAKPCSHSFHCLVFRSAVLHLHGSGCSSL